MPTLSDRQHVELAILAYLLYALDLMRPGGTRILCNPAGAGFANPAFADGLVVAVG